MSVPSRRVPVVGEIVRYTYRLRPGARAEQALMAEWHRCRWLWNEAVHWEKSGRKPTLCKLRKLLTEARARSAWLAGRTFQRQDCGYTADRDRNAARVILASAERGRAGADDVRHSFPGASCVRSELETSGF